MSETADRIVQDIGLNLDDVRELLQEAVERNGALERQIRGHELHVHDMHSTLSQVHQDAQTLQSPVQPTQLIQVTAAMRALRDSVSESAQMADTIRDNLAAARWMLFDIGAQFADLHSAADPADTAETAELHSRAEKLTLLVEQAVPMLKETAQRLTDARTAIEAGLTPSWSATNSLRRLDLAVYDSTRDVAVARAHSQHGLRLGENAMTAATNTAAHSRQYERWLHAQAEQQPPSHDHRHDPAPSGPGPSGPSI